MDADLLLVVLIVFLATLVRSTFGFGDALVGMPLLSMVIGVRTATPLVALIAMTAAIVILMRDWQSVQFGSAGRLFVASALGLPVGVAVLKYANEAIVTSILAVVILAFSGYALYRPRWFSLSNDRPAWLFGFAAGVLGGAYNTLGPPVVIFGTLRRWPTEHFRATLQGYFLPTGLLILAGHGMAGLWTPVVLDRYVAAVPILLVSLPLGRWLNRRFEAERFTRLVHGLLIIIAILLLVTALRT